jgi:uncharacterized protein
VSLGRVSPELVGVATGSVFAIGLSLSGMTDPRKVLAFLDVFGAWDPTLAFVMLGAIGVHFSWLRWMSARAPAAVAGRIDAQLLLGSAIFGVGWGLSGYCPGPALVALAFGRVEALLFVLAMSAGMMLHSAFDRGEAPSASLREQS